MGGDVSLDLVGGLDLISIHAPAWGATVDQQLVAPSMHDFNSRPRVGGDTPALHSQPTAHISIHAPAWGATRRCTSSSVCLILFQFTPPRGGRPAESTTHLAKSHFNSRPRVGGDLRAWPPPSTYDAFQFTPPRGGRLDGGLSTCILAQFQFTPPRGGRRPSGRRGGGHAGHFNSRPRVGGDEVSLYTGLRIDISIHAPAWGATEADAQIRSVTLFQFTPPRGGRP